MVLRNKRKSLNLTLEQMANRLEVTTVAIHHYETGKRLPRLNQVLLVARAYQLTTQEIISWLEESQEK